MNEDQELGIRLTNFFYMLFDYYYDVTTHIIQRKCMGFFLSLNKEQKNSKKACVNMKFEEHTDED